MLYHALSVALMVLFLTTDVFMRFTFNRPIVGQLKLVRCSWLVWYCISKMRIRSQTPKCYICFRLHTPKVKSVTNIIVLFLSLFASIILAWQTASSAIYLKQVYRTYSLIRVPYYPFYWIMTAGFVVLCLAIIVLILSRKKEVTHSDGS